jgi:hypothetical protein
VQDFFNDRFVVRGKIFTAVLQGKTEFITMNETRNNRVSMVRTNQMKMAEIRNKAKAHGIEPGNMSKTELIRAIQKAENCEACFGTSDGQCIHTACCFREDCLKPKQVKKANVQIDSKELNACLAMIQRINTR